MPYRKRLHIAPTEDWSQPRLQFTWPEQVSSELIRPVVLFGSSPAERAKQTGVPEGTLRRKEEIDGGQAWQSYIETTFNIQRRMAGWHFASRGVWISSGTSASATGGSMASGRWPGSRERSGCTAST